MKTNALSLSLAGQVYISQRLRRAAARKLRQTRHLKKNYLEGFETLTQARRNLKPGMRSRHLAGCCLRGTPYSQAETFAMTPPKWGDIWGFVMTYGGTITDEKIQWILQAKEYYDSCAPDRATYRLPRALKQATKLEGQALNLMDRVACLRARYADRAKDALVAKIQVETKEEAPAPVLKEEISVEVPAEPNLHYRSGS